ncbi:MAG: ribose-phosphate pyrophosphokinase [Nitrosomonas sp.]|nr:MAG: ribose-phosphate pyrophosphokinase [Nitrosomonas sp.]
MILFALPQYKSMGQELAREIPGLYFEKIAIMRFSNAELYTTVTSKVKGERCIILGSLAPPDEQLIAICLLTHTLKQKGALQVVGLFPYLGYARQDKAKTDQSHTLAWAGKILTASGLDQIMTIDIHSQLADQLVPIPIKSYLPTGLFKAGMPELHHAPDTTLIAPDEGATGRAHALARELKRDMPVVTFRKKRTTSSLVHTAPPKIILTKNAVIIDDILDTGGTLLSCVRQLKGAGVNSVVIAITHGLFTGSDWRKLFHFGVKHIYVTDSTPETRQNRTKRVCKISSIPLLQTIISDLLRQEP